MFMVSVPQKRLSVHIGICTFIVLLALFLSSCGSMSSTTTTSSQPAGSSKSQSSSSSSYYDSSPTPAATPTTTSATGPVKTASATVGGKSETILTNAQGMTLYYLTSDTKSHLACSGGCAQAWPPLVFSGSGSVPSDSQLSGQLGVSANANGNQVVYNDHPLYTFSGDSSAGQTQGEGIQGAGGTWHVATSDLAENS